MLQVPTWLALKAMRRDSTAASPGPFCCLWMRLPVCSQILLPWSHNESINTGEEQSRVWAGAVEVQRERLSIAEGTQLHKHLKGAHQAHLQKQNLLNPALFDLCPPRNNDRAT